MARKVSHTAALEKKAGPRSGNVKATIYMPPAILTALMAEARRRADEKGVVRADVSAVAVEAIEAGLAKVKR